MVYHKFFMQRYLKSWSVSFHKFFMQRYLKSWSVSLVIFTSSISDMYTSQDRARVEGTKLLFRDNTFYLECSLLLFKSVLGLMFLCVKFFFEVYAVCFRKKQENTVSSKNYIITLNSTNKTFCNCSCYFYNIFQYFIFPFV